MYCATNAKKKPTRYIPNEINRIIKLIFLVLEHVDAICGSTGQGAFLLLNNK